jgi:hypothetical protein
MQTQVEGLHDSAIPDDRVWWGWAMLGGGSFFWLFGCGVGWGLSGARHKPDGFTTSVLWGVVLGAPAMVAALVTFAKLTMRLVRGRETSPLGLLMSTGALGGGLLTHWMVFDLWMQQLYPHYFAHGRRLHRGGQILAPRSAPGNGWLGSAVDREGLHVPEAMRDGIAAQWRENAAKEHASIAAFAHLTLDLMAVGAPARLVKAAQEAAGDECRHAEQAYAIAARMDGRAESPAPFPDAFARRPLCAKREIALAQIAVDALLDGALNEGIASRILARLSRHAATRELCETLSAIASDEARHAKDSWDVVEWCLEAGGVTVARALEDARVAMPQHLGSPLPEAARDGAWTPWGVQGVALEVAEYAVVRRGAQRRLGELLMTRMVA